VTPISVDCRRTDAGWECSVTVGDDPGATSDEVTVTVGVWSGWRPAALSPPRSFVTRSPSCWHASRASRSCAAPAPLIGQRVESTIA
jgi:hypothetical protein